MSRCVRCDEMVDPGDPNMLYEVRGWEKKRKQGGQNHVLDHQHTGRVMCGSCAVHWKTFSDQGTQTTLL